MSEAFRGAEGPLAERILAALEAGQAAAATRAEPVGSDPRRAHGRCRAPWKNRTVDLRVEDHPEPIKELRRLVTLQRAYALADEGDGAFARKDYAAAMHLYDAALQLAPGNDELIFWRGSMKMGIGDEAGAADDCRQAIEWNPRWRDLIARLPDSVFPGVERVCERLEIPRTPARR